MVHARTADTHLLGEHMIRKQCGILRQLAVGLHPGREPVGHPRAGGERPVLDRQELQAARGLRSERVDDRACLGRVVAFDVIDPVDVGVDRGLQLTAVIV